MSIHSVLNIARTALNASQASIQVTSHNVANVNTKGYARQSLVLESVDVTSSQGNVFGGGVNVKNVMSHYDMFLEKSIFSKNSDRGYWDGVSSYLDRIESILSEENSNLATRITAFFNSWHELTLDPGSAMLRANVAASGESLAVTMRNISGDLMQVQTELDQNIGLEIDEINRLLGQIADINNKIYQNVVSGAEANDLIVKRNVALKELAGKIDIAYIEDQHGMITVTTSRGKILVQGGHADSLTTVQDPATGLKRVAWQDVAGNVLDISDEITGGSLRAYLDVRDQYLGQGFMKDIDELAKSIMNGVNDFHRTGYNLNGTTGIPFFSEITGNYAKDMRVSTEILTDPGYIATSSLQADILNNDIALNIATLGNEPVQIDGKNITIIDYLGSVMGKAGGYAKNAREMKESSEAMLTIMERQRESISGVSIDEEMANLIKYQYSYQAAARLIGVAEQMFTTLFEAFR